MLLTAVFPRNDMPPESSGIDVINARLARFAEQRGIGFIDINERLSDAPGRLSAEMTNDGLHLSLEGYRIWADALSPALEALLGPRSDTDLAPAPTGNPAAL